MSKSNVSNIAAIKNITESEARGFCIQVQKCFKAGVPPYRVIAKAVEIFPDATAKEIALSIDSDLTYGVKAKLSTRKNTQKTKRFVFTSSEGKNILKAIPDANDHPSWLSDKKLIKTVANLIPDENRGNEEIAKHILIDLSRSMPNAARILTSEQVIKVLKRVKRSGKWNFRQLMLEARKEVYGYSGDPDLSWVKVVSIPMGGKPR